MSILSVTVYYRKESAIRRTGCAPVCSLKSMYSFSSAGAEVPLCFRFYIKNVINCLCMSNISDDGFSKPGISENYRVRILLWKETIV